MADKKDEAKPLVLDSAYCVLQYFDIVGKRNGIRTIKTCATYTKEALFWKKWRKKTERDQVTQVHSKMATNIEAGENDVSRKTHRHLCVFICGRSLRPRLMQRSIMFLEFLRTMSTSTRKHGEGTSVMGRGSCNDAMLTNSLQHTQHTHLGGS